jgi:hypothetical protein
MRFDGNTFFALQIHRIQQLILHFALFNRLRHFQKPIGQGRFPVIDVCDNAEIPNVPLHGKKMPLLWVRTEKMAMFCFKHKHNNNGED